MPPLLLEKVKNVEGKNLMEAIQNAKAVINEINPTVENVFDKFHFKLTKLEE
jgi:hypothetical protein